MPATMQGPAIFLAQFAGDAAPFNSLDSICGWAAGLGYKGVQVPSWDARLFDLDKAAAAMVAGGFRHLVICEGPQVVGVLSVRDVVRVWSAERAAAPA